MTGRMKSKNYTERALAKEMIPSFCYVPRKLRGEGQLSVKITQADIIDNHKRIAEADPLGWIIAVMNGQPIPHFSVEKGDLVLQYVIPKMEARMQAAEWLAGRVTFKHPNAWKQEFGRTRYEAEDYNTMIENRAAQNKLEKVQQNKLVEDDE